MTLLMLALALLCTQSYATNNTAEPLRIYLEGSIGAGKSTLVDMLEKNGLAVVQEPVDTWVQTKALNAFYENPARYGYSFQTFVLTTISDMILNAPEQNGLVIFERSLYSNRYCFVENMLRKNMFTLPEQEMYKKSYEIHARNLPNPDAFIYLRATPETCMQRIKKRSRSAESNLPMELLEELHQLHEEWLISRNEKCTDTNNVPVLVLDGNSTFEETDIMLGLEETHLQKIKTFIEELQIKKQMASMIPVKNVELIDKEQPQS